MKHYYQNSKHKVETKHDFDINEKSIGKRPPNREGTQDASEKEMVVGNHCSVGYVVRIIVRGIFRSIRVVVDPIYIVLKRQIQFIMLVITSLGSMKLWKIGR